MKRLLLLLLIVPLACHQQLPPPRTCVPLTWSCAGELLRYCSPQGRQRPVMRCTDVAPVPRHCVEVGGENAECRE